MEAGGTGAPLAALCEGDAEKKRNRLELPICSAAQVLAVAAARGKVRLRGSAQAQARCVVPSVSPGRYGRTSSLPVVRRGRVLILLVRLLHSSPSVSSDIRHSWERQSSLLPPRHHGQEARSRPR